MELFSWFLPPIHGKTVECSLPACSFHQSLATQKERPSTGYYLESWWLMLTSWVYNLNMWVFLYQTHGNYVIFAWDGIHDLRQNPRRSVGVAKEGRTCHLQILLWMVGENHIMALMLYLGISLVFITRFDTGFPSYQPKFSVRPKVVGFAPNVFFWINCIKYGCSHVTLDSANLCSFACPLLPHRNSHPPTLQGWIHFFSSSSIHTQLASQDIPSVSIICFNSFRWKSSVKVTWKRHSQASQPWKNTQPSEKMTKGA